MISTYTLNDSNLKLVDYDCAKSNSWENLLFENQGSFNREAEFLAFDMNGLELVIFYDLSVSGKVDYNPSCTDVSIIDEDITVTNVTLDEYDIELTKELKSFFSKVVKKYV